MAIITIDKKLFFPCSSIPQKAIFCLSTSLIGSWWYLDFKSWVLNTLACSMASKISFSVGMAFLSYLVCWFISQWSPHIIYFVQLPNTSFLVNIIATKTYFLEDNYMNPTSNKLFGPWLNQRLLLVTIFVRPLEYGSIISQFNSNFMAFKWTQIL